MKYSMNSFWVKQTADPAYSKIYTEEQKAYFVLWIIKHEIRAATIYIKSMQKFNLYEFFS